MRIYFEDKSYVEISKSPSRSKYFVTVGARQDHEIIVNSAEVTKAQLGELVSDIPLPTKSEPKKPTPKKAKKETKPKKKTTRKKRAVKTKAVERPEAEQITGKPLDGYA